MDILDHIDSDAAARLIEASRRMKPLPDTRAEWLPAARPDGIVPQDLEGALGKNLVSAAVSEGRFHDVRPAVPFPMDVDRMKFHGRLTAKDLACYDLLLAIARENPDEQEHLYRWSALANALGLARQSDLGDVFIRLSRARVSYRMEYDGFTEVADHIALVSMATIIYDGDPDKEAKFQIPFATMRLLTHGGEYEHTELAPIMSFRSRWSAALYRVVLRIVHAADIGPLGGTTEFTDTPEAVAEEMHWHATGDAFLFKQFRQRALEPAIEDLRHLTRLHVEIEYERGSGRGAPVVGVRFKIRVHPSRRETLRSHGISPGSMRYFSPFPGGLREDLPEYRVRPGVWFRGVSLFPESQWEQWKKWNPDRLVPHGARPRLLADAWQVALKRALDGDAEWMWLLEDIKARDADKAAEAFLDRMAERPDWVITPLVVGCKADKDELREATHKRDVRVVASRPERTTRAPAEPAEEAAPKPAPRGLPGPLGFKPQRITLPSLPEDEPQEIKIPADVQRWMTRYDRVVGRFTDYLNDGPRWRRLRTLDHVQQLMTAQKEGDDARVRELLAEDTETWSEAA